MYQPFSKAKSYFKNNIDTIVRLNVNIGTSTGLQDALVVSLNGSDVANANLQLAVLDSSGISIAYLIENGVLDTDYTLQQNIATYLGGLSNTAFGEAAFCGLGNDSAVTNNFNSWDAMQQYISQNGFSSFRRYEADWIYNTYGATVSYWQGNDSFILVSRLQNNTSASSSIQQNSQLEKTKKFYPSSLNIINKLKGLPYNSK